MYGQVHANYVLYKHRPQVGHRYRQIVIHELESFLVISGEGEVVRDGADFAVNNPDAEAGVYDNLPDAHGEAGAIFERSVAEGWKPYEGEHL